jgi:hypothetical protein
MRIGSLQIIRLTDVALVRLFFLNLDTHVKRNGRHFSERLLKKAFQVFISTNLASSDCDNLRACDIFFGMDEYLIC